MIRVDVAPKVLRWARDRASLPLEDFEAAGLKVGAWERRETRPTLKQLERFAHRAHVPVGYLFLAEPPEETLSLPDLRTVGDVPVGRPSPDLIDTIQLCEARQEWYRTYLRSLGEPRVAFVGSVTVGDDPVPVAASIRSVLQLDPESRRTAGTWEDALRALVAQAEDAGVLVMVNGVVGVNTHRPLDADDFRGFAMSDDLAPLVFVNGRDTKSAQMFTLAHELAHIWSGESAVSAPDVAHEPADQAERWCNQVAAEVLVPIQLIRSEYRQQADVTPELERLARVFKVSTLVILRRIHDIGAITERQLWRFYAAERERLRKLRSEGGTGGNFHLTEAVRVSRRFARALVASTLEGQTLYRDAYRMLGFSKEETFKSFARVIGVEG